MTSSIVAQATLQAARASLITNSKHIAETFKYIAVQAKVNNTVTEELSNIDIQVLTAQEQLRVGTMQLAQMRLEEARMRTDVCTICFLLFYINMDAC